MSEQDKVSIPELWKTRELKNALGISRSKLDRLLAAGDIPAPFWIGGEKYWLAENVRNWLLSKATVDRKEAAE